MIQIAAVAVAQRERSENRPPVAAYPIETTRTFDQPKFKLL